MLTLAFVLLTCVVPFLAVGSSALDALQADRAGQTAGGGTALTGAIHTPVVPISVVSAQWMESDQNVSFTLRNDTDKTITAWNVQIQFPHSIAPSSEHGVDSYVAAAGLVPVGYHIPPRGTVTKTTRTQGPASLSAVIQIIPTAAIFDDRSAVGDSKFADYVFARRARDRQAWQEVLVILEQARNTAGPIDAVLQGAVSRLQESLVQNGQDPVRANARTNFSLALADVQNGRGSAGARLDVLEDQAQRSMAAAVAHSRP